MQRKLIAICGILALLAIAFWIGRLNGASAASHLQSERALKLHKELIDLDRSFLTNAITNPNTMVSGTYTLETKFAEDVPKISPLQLEFSQGRLIKSSDQTIENIVQSNNLISWIQSNTNCDECPVPMFVGVIDGNTMWGKVYVAPGQGWHEGEAPAYGIWKLSPTNPSR